ncbi:MAG: PASTA domain-containing protein, partial [Nocardioidaceae bacterium]
MRADIERALNGQSVTAPAVVGDPNPGPPGDDAATAVVPALDDNEEEPCKRRKSPWILLAVLIALLIAAFFIIPAVFGGGDENEPDVSVPDVVGEEQAAAIEQIEAEGLVADVERSPSESVNKGLVISQDPPGGDFLFAGDTVTITISTGPRTVQVPNNLIGAQVKEAKRELEAVGLTWEVEKEPSSERNGQVLDVQPAEGEEVSPNSEVTLTVSEGYPRVPDVRGLSEGEATDALEAEGFSVDPREVETENAEDGTVFDQAPGPGEEALPGSTVIIFIAVEPEDDETTPPTPSETPPTATPTTPSITLPTLDD